MSKNLTVAPLLRVGEEVALFSGNPVFCALGSGKMCVVFATEVVLEVGMSATDKDGGFASGSGCGSWFVRPLAPVCASIVDEATDSSNLADFKMLTTFEIGVNLGEVTRGVANVSLDW